MKPRLEIMRTAPHRPWFWLVHIEGRKIFIGPVSANPVHRAVHFALMFVHGVFGPGIGARRANAHWN